MKHKLKPIFFAVVTLLASGCSSHPSHHEGHAVFKGKVVKVEYHLPRHTTVLFDSEGKTTTLHGHPGVPCTEVEIFEEGTHRYRIYRGTPSS